MALTDKQKQMIDDILSNPNLTDLKKEEVFGNILKGLQRILESHVKTAGWIFLDNPSEDLLSQQDEIDRVADLYNDLKHYPPLLDLIRKNNDAEAKSFPELEAQIKELKEKLKKELAQE